MGADTHKWDKKDLPAGKTVQEMADAMKQVLNEYGFGRYQMDEIGSLVIDKYTHCGCGVEKLGERFIKWPSKVIMVPGNLEMMYYKDGSDVTLKETTFSRADFDVGKEVYQRTFAIRFTNNIDDGLHGAAGNLRALLNWELGQLWRPNQS